MVMKFALQESLESLLQQTFHPDLASNQQTPVSML